MGTQAQMDQLLSKESNAIARKGKEAWSNFLELLIKFQAKTAFNLEF